MRNLTNEALLHCYQVAVKLRLDEAFIRLVEEELRARNLGDVIQSYMAR